MSDDDFLRVGRVTGAHGLNGRLKIAVMSDNPGRFETGNSIYINRGSMYDLYTIDGFQPVKQRSALLSLKEVSDRNQAEALSGAALFITKDDAERTRGELDDDSFYYYDIIGCDVYLDNNLFAKVTDIIQAGGGDILVIKDKNGKDLMIPFVESMTDTSHVGEGRIDISPVEGLFDI